MKMLFAAIAATIVSPVIYFYLVCFRKGRSLVDVLDLFGLLKHGGNPNLIVSDVSGETVLFTAIHNHRLENVEILVNAGSNINHQSKGGDTPIMMASSSTHYDIAYRLMEMGADLSIRNHVMGPDMKWRKNAGSTFAEQMVGFGDRSIRILGKEKEQREWYEKVVTELKRRGLL